MIYLIDDNQAEQRKLIYTLDFVDDGTYSSIMKSVKKIKNEGDARHIHHLDFLKDATCILMHSTTEGVDENNHFIKGDISNVTKIKESISEHGDNIPLVLFSNGMENLVYDFKNKPRFLQKIKKNDFYVRLYDFLEDYKRTGQIELRILAYGKNFLQLALEQLSESILISIAGRHEDDLLKLSDISPYLSNFKEFMTSAGLETRVDDILKNIEDNPSTVGKFRDNIISINESFTKHGKNLHDWLQ